KSGVPQQYSYQQCRSCQRQNSPDKHRALEYVFEQYHKNEFCSIKLKQSPLDSEKKGIVAGKLLRGKENYYLPVKLALRFSRKAAVPSVKSLVATHFPNKSISVSKPSIPDLKCAYTLCTTCA